MLGDDIGFRADRLRRRRRRTERRRAAHQPGRPARGRRADRGDRPRPRSPGCGPSADLTTSRRSAGRPRGGYGDAYLTAQAFAASARAAGVRIRQGADGHRAAGRRRPGHGRAPGRRRDVAAGTVVVAAGPGRRRFSRRTASMCPSGCYREQIVPIAPGIATGSRPGVLRPGVAAVHPARGGRRAAVRQQRPVRCRAGRPRRLPQPGHRGVRRPRRRQGRHRFPGFSDAAISSSYAGCYDVTPDLNPVISGTAARRPVRRGGLQRPRLQDLARGGPAGRRPRHRRRSADPRIPESDFRLSRFAENDLLKTPYPYVGAGQMR